MLLSIGCNSGLKNPANADSDALDSSLVEPSSVNNLFLDSSMVSDFLKSHPEFKNQNEQVWKFYKKRDYQFAWFNNDGMVEQAAHFMNMLVHFREEGISDTSVYNPRLQMLYDSLSNGFYIIQGQPPE